MWGLQRPGVVLLVLVAACAQAIRIKRDVLDDNLNRYLTTFGYMPRSQDGAFALRTEDSIREAIKQLQKFAGIPTTGRVDQETEQLLKRPRCGLPDLNDEEGRPRRRRRRRFTLQGQKWPFTNLTWSLRSTNINLNPYEVRLVIKKALDVWAKHSTLTFTEVNHDQAHILIYFHRYEHGDNFAFDGKGVVLAHAFFPNGGRSIEVHFDADETWTTSPNSNEGTNLFNVAAHEFGHSLGLSHSSVEGALMYPWYTDIENGDTYELPDDDKLAIQALYGSRQSRWETNKFNNRHWTWATMPSTTTSTTTTSTTTTRRPPYHNYPKKTPMMPKKPYKPPQRTTPKHYYPTERPNRHGGQKPNHRHHKESDPKMPNTCDTSYDAVSVIRREVFFFKDKYFWRISEDGRLLPGYPAEIRRLWSQLPHSLTHVDAVYERPDNKIVFFIGRHYYVFRGNFLESGYPRTLVDLGLPESVKKIDAAMVWGHNAKTFLYSGDVYWRFDEETGKVEGDYPRSISMWSGIGEDIDAAFQWKDKKTYFFKGKGFWKFNDMSMRVESEEQQSSASFWMGCAKNLEGDGKKLPLRQADEDSGAIGSGEKTKLCVWLFLVVRLLLLVAT